MAEKPISSSQAKATKSSASSNDRSKGKDIARNSKCKKYERKEEDQDPGNCFCRSRRGGRIIQCDACQRWCHPPCVGISMEVLNAIGEDTQYFCPLCILKRFSSKKDGKEGASDRASVDRLTKELELLRKEFEEIKTSISSLSNKIRIKPKKRLKFRQRDSTKSSNTTREN